MLQDSYTLKPLKELLFRFQEKPINTIDKTKFLEKINFKTRNLKCWKNFPNFISYSNEPYGLIKSSLIQIEYQTINKT